MKMKFESSVFSPPPVQKPRQARGVHALQRSNAVGPPSALNRKSRTVTSRNPTNNLDVTYEAPERPSTTDSLNPFRAVCSRQRARGTIEERHQAELQKDPKSFFREKGDLGSYLEMAHSQSDMLVWQRGQHREDALLDPLNDLHCRSQTEVYDVSEWSMANTERSSQSPMLTHRHKLAHVRRVRSEILGSAGSSRGRRVGSSRPQTSAGAPRSHAVDQAERRATRNELLNFERSQHQKVNFQDWTKKELIELIEAEGLEVPGELKWDSDAGCMKKEQCKKHVYIDYCRRKFFEVDPQPMVKHVCKLGIAGIYCIISIFKASCGSVRIVAYHDQDGKEYQLLLIQAKLDDLDIRPTPESEDQSEWDAWSRLILPRLELTQDGFLRIGTPPIKDNGLPDEFTLTGSYKGGKAGKPGQAQPPSRLHVTLFFDKL